ncbi:hypothetical protein SPHINGO361_40029 [Sphingomonas sp. EC-HK361]|nr:hypothetical protein SPHINGO361_40029 [Sphingomonas sp. EC-HK361]
MCVATGLRPAGACRDDHTAHAVLVVAFGMIANLIAGALGDDERGALHQIAVASRSVRVSERLQVAQENVAVDDDDPVARFEIGRELYQIFGITAGRELGQGAQFELERSVTTVMDDERVVDCGQAMAIVPCLVHREQNDELGRVSLHRTILWYRDEGCANAELTASVIQPTVVRRREGCAAIDEVLKRGLTAGDAEHLPSLAERWTIGLDQPLRANLDAGTLTAVRHEMERAYLRKPQPIPLKQPRAAIA